MRVLFTLTLLVTLATFSSSAMADGRPGPPWDFEFSYVSESTELPNDALRWFDLEMQYGDPLAEIVYLELEITGLTHTDPEDLRVELLDPFGGGIIVMEDAGDGHEITNLTMIFSGFTGKEDSLPHGTTELLAGPATVYRPDGSEDFTQYYGTPVGLADWIITLTDDGGSVGGGSFESATLRGIVPEPATLSLLALGILAALRRRFH